MAVLMCVLMQLALKRTQDAALERLTVAATEGDLDSVKNLLARGLPINKVCHLSRFSSCDVAIFSSCGPSPMPTARFTAT